jgi:hypothetical protein
VTLRDFPIEGIAPLRQPVRGLVGFLLHTLRLGHGVRANIDFAFGLSHPKEISEQVEARRNRHSF